VTQFRIALAIAFFFALASTAAAVTLTATPSTVAPGGTVTVTWSDVTSPTRLDWIGEFIQGAPDAAYENYVYTNSCSQTPGVIAVASGSCTFTMPTMLGTYEFRLFANNGNDVLARSGPVQVSITPPATATLTASPSTVAPGGNVTVTWSGVTNATRLDWIGRYIQGAPDTAYDNFAYTSSCTPTAGANAVASGSCTFPMPTVVGTYEFRLFADNGGNLLARSGLVQVSPPPVTPALTASPSTVAPGGSVTVTWSGVSNPNTLDWIGRYIPGASDSQRDTFVYTSSCSQTAGTNAVAAGSCPFTMPVTLGSYEFRLFASTGTKLATSSLVQVSISPQPPSGGGARVVTYTTSTVLTADDVNRSIINNSGANAPITLNLPPAAVGNVVTVYVIAAQPITINPNGTERIQILTNANGDAIQSDSVRGTTITLVCHVLGSWEPMGQIGAWFDVN
jgi:hypothetical protein